jgi:hypothetical protein
MADYYVDSNAGGAGTGADWANAFTSLATAVTGKAAGDRFFVAHDHAGTAAALTTITFPGTLVNPNICLCVNKAGSVPPVAADLRDTATVSTTGNSGLSLTGCAYIYGITFVCGSGAVAARLTVGSSGNTWMKLENCILKKGGTTGNATGIQVGHSSTATKLFEFVNVGLDFAVTSDGFGVYGGSKLLWTNTTDILRGTSLVPTAGFFKDAVGTADLIVDSVDFTDLGANPVFGSLTAGYILRASINRCKLTSAQPIVNAAPAGVGTSIDVIRSSDTGGPTLRQERHTAVGILTTETTIVRTGSLATDGYTPISYKVVTSANTKRITPFELFPIRLWNDVEDANRTVTVYGTWGGGAVPNNDDIWMDVSYSGDNASAMGTIHSTGIATPLTAASAVASDGSTWGGGTTPFKLVASLTSPQPRNKGPMQIRVFIGDTSETYYIDPAAVLS